MSNVQTYQKYLSSEYPGFLSFIENIIEPIFGSKFEANTGLLQKASNTKLVDRFENIIRTSSDEQLKMEAQNSGLTSMIKLGSIELDNTEVPLLVYDITISESKDLAKNRKGIQSLTRRMLEKNSGAFMIFHYADKQWEWRFSYCFKGMSDEDSTNAKRFTYLLGPNQACKTAAQRFDKLRKQNGCIRLQDIEEAFNVEALSQEFFEKYKVRYGRFVGHVIGKEYIDKGDGKGEWREKEGLTPSELFYGLNEDEKVVRDYVKKLLGRIVFLHFLQKKGWLGATDEEWTNGPQDFMLQLFENASTDQKENFLDDILEPLFSCLDTPLNQRREVFDTKVDGLRSVRVPFLGGLFERTEEDKALSIFPSTLFADLFNFLSEYNFTIDENDPNDAQVGVDPEMLGRIFENLLEDNKDKGAFYTPKEIVQYMCRESLIAYLQTNVTDEPTREALRQFVTTHDVEVLGGCASALAKNVSQCLKDVKICDPAIGSGAFPMGLLNELFLCRGVIEDFSNAAGIKRHIIEQNIFGVDIEKGAVEIARLRFWLSLITDAEKPDVLPNMDFKIMQGNSLLEQYKSYDLSHIMDTKKEIGAGYQYQMFEDQVDVIRAEVKRTIHDYYNENNHDMRRIMREGIQQKIQQQIAVQGINVDISDIKDIAANDQFFLWHTWFSDAFEENGGFDIVIGNPPYIDSETMVKVMPKERDLYAKKFTCASGNWDMFIVFIEFSISLLKENGIFGNIIPNKLIAAKYGVELRKRLSNTHVLEIRDYSRIDVFEDAAVYPITIVLRNSIKKDNTLFTIMENRVKVKQSNIADSNDLTKNDYWDPFFRDTAVFKLISKINAFNPLKNLPVEVLGAATVADAYEIKNIVQDSKSKDGFKLINSGTIDPYLPYWGIKPCRYIKGSYTFPIVPAEDLKNYSEVRYNQASCPKIIVASMTTRYEACLDVIGEYIAGKSTTIILGDTNYLYKLTAIINSKLASYWLNIVFNSLKMSGGAINIGRNELQILPIPDKDADFMPLVDKIMESKASSGLNGISAITAEIDRLVYDLYGLSEEEIKIVEGN